VADEIWIPPVKEEEEEPWSISHSLFNGYKQASDKDLESCFKFDFKISSLEKLLTGKKDDDK